MKNLPNVGRCVRGGCFAFVLLSTAFVPAQSSAFDVRWCASAGVGYPTEIGEYVEYSSRVAGALMVRFTSATYLGAMADYTSYQTTTSVTAGSHRRALALLQWNVVRDRLPSWFHPFGQIGFGGGEMEYVGFTRVERLRGLAARVAAGAQFCVHPRLDLAAVVSFDRLDVAPDQMGRFYPTMLSVNLEIALHWPNGEPLIRSAMIR